LKLIYKRIANPASSFFDKPIIQGDNMEVGNIYSSSGSPLSKYLEPRLKNLTGKDLKLLNVKCYFHRCLQRKLAIGKPKAKANGSCKPL